MKKTLVLIIAFLLCGMLILPVMADVEPVVAEEALPFTATVDDEFEGGSLIVTIKKEYGAPNWQWSLSDFGNNSHIVSIVNLTACDNEEVLAAHSANENFRQIVEVVLDDTQKQTAITVGNQIAQLPFVRHVAVNYNVELNDETVASNNIAPASALPTPADDFTSNYRNIINDPYIDDQYEIFTTFANRAWSITTGSLNVVVGVIDTGIDPIPDLVDNLVPGYNMISHNRFDPMPEVGATEPYYDASSNKHGTMVASVIAAKQNSIGTVGAAPNVKVMPLRVATSSSEDPIGSALVRAFCFATTLNLPILNFSAVTASDFTSGSGLYDHQNYEWLQAILNYPGLIVCAAGNNEVLFCDSTDLPVDLDESISLYPGEFQNQGAANLLVVGTVEEDNDWDVSNWSDELVDLMAPGVDMMLPTVETVRNPTTNAIESMDVYYDYANLQSGSSFSAPLVAAAAALLLSYNPTLTVQQLKNAIVNNTTVVPELSDRCKSSGVLNIYKALLSVSTSAMNSYCVLISADANNVYSASGITIQFPADEVRLTDVFMNSNIALGVHNININYTTDTINLSFASYSALPLNKGDVAFEFWFNAPVQALESPFATINSGFSVSTGSSQMLGQSFLLGDIGKVGVVDSGYYAWVDFFTQDNFPPAADVNRDHLFDNNDVTLVQQYINGTIKTFF